MAIGLKVGLTIWREVRTHLIYSCSDAGLTAHAQSRHDIETHHPRAREALARLVQSEPATREAQPKLPRQIWLAEELLAEGLHLLHLAMTIGGRAVEDSQAVSRLHIQLASGIDQPLHSLHMACCGGIVQRICPAGRPGVDAGSSFQQLLDHRHVTGRGRIVQGCEAI